MPFLQLTITIGTADPEPFEEALLAAGALSITLQDAADDAVLEPPPGTTPLWPTVRLSALFEATASRDAIEGVVRAHSAARTPALHFQMIEDRAWEREWLKDFRPMRFGERLWICPGGQRPSIATTATEPASTPCIVELDPGLAFGTGTHTTTALCLEWLDRCDVRDARVIDYGCGSGVLAIAALKLGARAAIAIDIDLQAVLATRDNALRNGVADKLTVYLGDVPEIEPATVVVANILAEPLAELAPRLARLVTANGRLAMSGLLATQAGALASRYAEWFALEPPTVRDGWVRLTGVRHAPH